MATTIETVATRFFTYGSGEEPVVLASGGTLPEVTIAYETYGELNATRDNAVLVFHALTGSQHAAGLNPAVPTVGDRWTEECTVGWWDGFIGPGKALDTSRYFVVSANYLGGCYGSTGPASIDPRTGVPYGSRFSPVGFTDIVDSQVRLLRHLGVERLRAVIGGSTGGILCLSLATRYPRLVDVVIPIATGTRVTTLQAVHNFEQMTAIQSDPAFAGGDYYGNGGGPEQGLALARMIGHKTFVSLEAMEHRARPDVEGSDRQGTAGLSHPVESYLSHQGRKFVRRFDANSYLRIMRAWQSHDLAADAGVGGFDELFRRSRRHTYLVFSIDSDVCFYPDEQDELVRYLKQAGVAHQRITVHSDKGHDSFLLEPELFAPHIADMLASAPQG